MVNGDPFPTRTLVWLTAKGSVIGAGESLALKEGDEYYITLRSEYFAEGKWGSWAYQKVKLYRNLKEVAEFTTDIDGWAFYPETAEVLLKAEVGDYIFFGLTVATDESEESTSGNVTINVLPLTPEEEKEILPPIPAPLIELPSLPWYATWLEPIIKYIGSLTEAVSNFFAPIFLPIKDVAVGITDFGSGFLDKVRDRMGELLGYAVVQGESAFIAYLISVISGSPEEISMLTPVLDKKVVGYGDRYLKAIDPWQWVKPDVTDTDAFNALQNIRHSLMETGKESMMLHMLIEAGSMGQVEAMRDWDNWFTSKLGIDSVVQQAMLMPLEKAVLKRAEYAANETWTPEIPTYADLINMVVKEVITVDEFAYHMARQGFNKEWAARIWDAHFIPPAWTQILQAYYRGAIDKDTMQKMKILVDLDPRYDAVWDAQIEVIPPYSELTNELVKEVIALPEYTKYLQWWGYDAKWAKRIWDAHFIPPSLTDMLTAWRRGLIDEKRLDELMIIVDLDPRFKDIFDTRKYDDPTISLARFMFETGAINRDEVQEMVALQGYRPEHIGKITDFIVRFQERLWRRRYLVTLAGGYERDIYTSDHLKKEVLGAGYTEGVADWVIANADARRKIREEARVIRKPKILSVSDLKRAYLYDEITDDMLRTELLTRKYEFADIDLLIRVLDHDKIEEKEGRKVVALSITQWLSAYRYGILREDELRIKLLTRGLDLEEANMLIETKKAEWKMITEE